MSDADLTNSDRERLREAWTMPDGQAGAVRPTELFANVYWILSARLKKRDAWWSDAVKVIEDQRDAARAETAEWAFKCGEAHGELAAAKAELNAWMQLMSDEELERLRGVIGRKHE